MNIAAPHLAACFDYLTSQGIQFTARPPDFAGGVRWSVTVLRAHAKAFETAAVTNAWDKLPSGAAVVVDGRAQLVRYILAYESDTFSAELTMVRMHEAVRIADRLITDWSDHKLDGVMINASLAELREEEEQPLTTTSSPAAPTERNRRSSQFRRRCSS